MIKYPEIDPTIIKLGMFEIRWYGLIYIFGFLIAYIFLKKNFQLKNIKLKKEEYETLMFDMMLGVIIGGRIGYILFYNISYYFSHPLEIFAVWKGGMSFHGGALAVIIFGYLFCKKHNYSFYKLGDAVMPLASIALFLGRIGNFINAELWGRETDVPWAMIFPTDTAKLTRHPSQLYEALLEGLVLFIITYILFKKSKQTGLVFWTWIGLYGLFRFFIEFYREPDAQLGHLIGFLTMGQILCSIMFITSIIGIFTLFKDENKK